MNQLTYNPDIKTVFDNFLRHYPILLSKLDAIKIQCFLDLYRKFILEDNDIDINSLLLESEIIDYTLFNKLEEKKFSVIELALTTEFELSTLFQISKRLAFTIKILAQFHYANIFNGTTIYYAHPLDFYIDSIEEKDIALIKIYFPFVSRLINPSKFELTWRQEHLTNSEIMQRCFHLVSESDVLTFFPHNDKFIGKGVHDEVEVATTLEIPCYVFSNNKIKHYIFEDINENDWKNYCSFKAFSLINDRLVNENSNEISQFLIKNQKTIEEDIIQENKKYIIAVNNTSQSYFVIRQLYNIFNQSKFKIAPIIGKKALCNGDHVNGVCESYKETTVPEDFDFFTTLGDNILKNENTNLINEIKRSTPKNYCPYNLLYETVFKANIIVINKIFFKSVRLRSKLISEILFNYPYNFVLIFDTIKDLFNDHIESRCFVEDLNKFNSELEKINYNKRIKATSIIQKLRKIKEGEKINVKYDLTEFLKERYKKKELNVDLLEKVYNICKTPFGYWIKRNNEIIQVIGPDALKNFLNNFSKVYFLNSEPTGNARGGEHV